MKPTLVAVEALLADEASYDVALGFLEAVQNVVSHGLSMFLTPEEVVPMLGPRGVVCWDTLHLFWSDVAAWCVENGLPLKSSAQLLSVENTELRTLIWTTHRSRPGGGQLGLTHAVRYEKATGVGIPGFSHIAVLLKMTE